MREGIPFWDFGFLVIEFSDEAIFEGFHFAFNCGLLGVHLAEGIFADGRDLAFDGVETADVVKGFTLGFFKGLECSRDGSYFIFLGLVDFGELAGFGVNKGVGLRSGVSKDLGELGSDFTNLLANNNFAILADDEGDKFLSVLSLEHFEQISAAGTHKICW